ncbi:MAG: tetratricopeptide repeat protein [Deltaproteobacteria bacterium]|nr:tetratricopeptide repeat protein [Deltaproteobacteria bacterium]
MTEEQESNGGKGGGTGGKSAEPTAPSISPLDDKLDFSLEEDEIKRGFLSMLNPANWFSRHSTEKLIREGRDLLDNGSLAQATVAFKRALNIDSKCVPAYRGLGKVFFKKGGRSNIETALAYYSEAIKINPLDADLYAITAKVYDAIGKRKEATLERKKFVIARALEVDEKNPVANNNMGILFLQQNRIEEAIGYFKKALDNDRNFDVAHRNLAATFYQQAKGEKEPGKKRDLIAKAKTEVEKALSIMPSVASLLAKGRILMMMGDFEAALAAANKADEMESANKDVFLLKKLSLERLGRFDEAKTAFESYQAFTKGDSGGDEE